MSTPKSAPAAPPRALEALLRTVLPALVHGSRVWRASVDLLAIETALTLRLLFHLPLRQTEGFLTSIFGMLGLDLSAP